MFWRKLQAPGSFEGCQSCGSEHLEKQNSVGKIQLSKIQHLENKILLAKGAGGSMFCSSALWGMELMIGTCWDTSKKCKVLIFSGEGAQEGALFIF